MFLMREIQTKVFFIFHSFLCLSIKFVVLKIDCKRTEKNIKLFSVLSMEKPEYQTFIFPSDIRVLFCFLLFERNGQQSPVSLHYTSVHGRT